MRTGPSILLAAVLAAVLATTGGAGFADAAETPAGEEDKDTASTAREPAREHEERERGQRLFRARLLQSLELTDEQRPVVQRILDAHDALGREWYAEHRHQVQELIRQMRQAHRDGDVEQLGALRKQTRELIADRPGRAELDEQLEHVLTEAQWERFQDNRKVLERAIIDALHRAPLADKQDDDEGDDETRHRRRPGLPDASRYLEGPLFEDIALTDEQVAKITQLVRAHQRAIREWHQTHREDLSDLRQQMGQARRADDRERLAALRRQLHEMRADAPTHHHLHARLQDVLDDAQWDQFQQNLQARQEHFQQRRERHDEQRGGRRDRERAE